MLNSIPASHIGNFTSVAEKRLYDKMTAVVKPAQEMADSFIRCDNQAADQNNSVRGSVLLDTPSLSGVCQFDPDTKVVKRLDAETVSYPTLDEDFDFEWPPRGGMTREHYSIARGDDGKVTYQTRQGTVTMNPDGSLFMGG